MAVTAATVGATAVTAGRMARRTADLRPPIMEATVLAVRAIHRVSLMIARLAMVVIRVVVIVAVQVTAITARVTVALAAVIAVRPS